MTFIAKNHREQNVFLLFCFNPKNNNLGDLTTFQQIVYSTILIKIFRYVLDTFIVFYNCYFLCTPFDLIFWFWLNFNILKNVGCLHFYILVGISQCYTCSKYVRIKYAFLDSDLINLDCRSCVLWPVCSF